MGRKTIDDLLQESRRSLRRLEPAQAHEAVRNGALLIDTRSGDDIAESGRVPGSVHVPLSVLEWRLDPASEFKDPSIASLDTDVILICAHGYSSSLAGARLQQLGFRNVADVVGGYTEWVAAGLPVEAAVEQAP